MAFPIHNTNNHNIIVPPDQQKKNVSKLRRLLSLQMILIIVLSLFPSPSNGFTVPFNRKNNDKLVISKKEMMARTRIKQLHGGSNGSIVSCIEKRKNIFQMTSSSGDSEGDMKRQNSNEVNENDEKISIAIVGSGAVGCYYGARLWECKDYNVNFFMRGEHYDTCKEKGLEVKSLHGDIAIPPESLNIYSSTEQMGQVDWVILALKSTALDAAPSLLLPLLKPSTRIIAIMNGLFEDDLVEMLEHEHQKKLHDGIDEDGEELSVTHPVGVPASPSALTCCKAVYGGMALICSNRIAPGEIDHSYAGKLTVGVAASGSSASSKEEDEHKEAVLNLWSPITKVEFVYTPSITRGRWTKNVWNLPFNGVSVAMGGITIDKVVRDEGLRRLADIVMDETISVANADLDSRGEDVYGYLGDAEKKEMWDLSDNMGPYKTSTMLDMINRKPMEVKYLFRKAIDRANRLNVPVPHLETLVMQIEAFQRFYNLY